MSRFPTFLIRDSANIPCPYLPRKGQRKCSATLPAEEGTVQISCVSTFLRRDSANVPRLYLPMKGQRKCPASLRA